MDFRLSCLSHNDSFELLKWIVIRQMKCYSIVQIEVCLKHLNLIYCLTDPVRCEIDITKNNKLYKKKFNNRWAKSSLKFCWILYLYDGIIFLRDIVFLLRILYSDAATGISLPKRRCTNNLAFRWFNSVTKNINLSAVS